MSFFFAPVVLYIYKPRGIKSLRGGNMCKVSLIHMKGPDRGKKALSKHKGL